MRKGKILLDDYFKRNSLVEADINSFNEFVDWRLQKLVDELGSPTPAVVPAETEEVKIEFGKIRIGKPSVIEADGVRRLILPSEARLRKLTYAAPLYLEIGLVIDGIERERREVRIGEAPVMIKSKICPLSKMSREELIDVGEDPYDTGGYFIINGTERVIIFLEDLAPNTLFVEKSMGASTHSAKIFSERGLYRIPHTVEIKKDGMILVSFTSLHKVPIFVLMRALGLKSDADIIKAINSDHGEEEIFLNLYEFLEIKNENDAKQFIARTMGLGSQPDERKIERINYLIDSFLFPHIGGSEKDRIKKAYFLGNMVRKLLLLKHGEIEEDDKDHYMNKRIRLSGDLLEDLYRKSLKSFVKDMLYVFQRGVRRGKILPISSIATTRVVTSRIRRSMATGSWSSGREGISQRLDRENALSSLSHLGRIVSPLPASQENFKARELHPTHWGRLCPVESPEGKNIGLRKNISLIAGNTPEIKEEELKKNLKVIKELGLEEIG
ncbi:MAG: DNA-directed RNA polymerase subunit B'' [Candidatus Woesearchaeota archaeon]|nr:MAG: DNA-directed RNA polymerase subunit B'' [Candidatus Woesearchaeota archaeon]